MTKLDKQVNDFKATFLSLDSDNQVKACRKLAKELRDNHTPSTARSYLTKYRKALIPLNKDVSAVLRIAKAEQNKIQAKQKKDVAKSNKALKPIRNYKQMIAVAEQLIKSGNLAKMTAGLCLLTGRRMSEVLKTAKFTNWGNNKNKAYFTGQMKGKSDSKLKDKYAVYTLTDRADIKKAIKQVQQIANVKGLTAKQINSKYANTVNSACWKAFDTYIGICTSKSLRKAYGTICKELYKESSQSDNSFLAEILGHGAEDLDTVNTYSGYYLK